METHSDPETSSIRNDVHWIQSETELSQVNVTSHVAKTL